MPLSLRSMLFVPGTRPDRFANALAAGADAVIFDLEDSVDPGRKDEARAAVVAFLGVAHETASQLFVRVNAFSSDWIDDDLAMAGPHAALRGVVLPKAEVPAEISAVARAIPSRTVIPLLETARGILRAASLVTAPDAVIPAVLFGAEDLTAEIGIPRTIDGDELLFARSQVVLAATAAGADALDAVFTDITAPEDLRRDALRARALGFRGKMAIHPDQIGIIHEVFSPSAAEIEAAQRIVSAFEEAEGRGEGVFRLDGRMIDRPVVLRAQRVLSR